MAYYKTKVLVINSESSIYISLLILVPKHDKWWSSYIVILLRRDKITSLKPRWWSWSHIQLYRRHITSRSRATMHIPVYMNLWVSGIRKRKWCPCCSQNGVAMMIKTGKIMFCSPKCSVANNDVQYCQV